MPQGIVEVMCAAAQPVACGVLRIITSVVRAGSRRRCGPQSRASRPLFDDEIVHQSGAGKAGRQLRNEAAPLPSFRGHEQRAIRKRDLDRARAPGPHPFVDTAAVPCAGKFKFT